MDPNANVSLAREPIGEVIGSSTPRLEAREKITGDAVYTDDMVLPGMLYGAILGSDYAHARILSCDTSKAKALAGVKAVLTSADVELAPVGGFVKDEPALARDKVRYVGEPIAVVAALDAETAAAAVKLIEVEYEELEEVLDMEEALKPGAPVIHEDKSNYAAIFELPDTPNAISYTQFKEGEPESIWDQCDVIVDGVYETPAQEHMYMEPCSTLASCDRNSGKVTVWSSLQSIFRVQALAAEAVCMPMSKLRVMAPRIGGGFGGKCELTHQPLAILLARATGGSVKLTLSREEDMTTTKTRHASRIYMRTGAKQDGTLVAREARLYFDSGAYADEGPEVSSVAAFFGRGPYRIPHCNVESWSVYTNKVKGGAFRGFGNPQATFASETQIDEIAARLDLDPIDVRLNNALQTGEKWLGGQSVETGSLRSCLEAVRDASDWDNRRRNLVSRPGKRRGLGVASGSHISALLGSAATVKLNEDGTVSVSTGAVDIGAGQDTVLAQCAAGALGLSLDQINYAAPDTDTSPFDFQTSASRVTYMVGKAVTEAGERVKEQLFEHAAQILECSEEDLELRPGGWVGMTGVPDAQVPFAGIAGHSIYVTGGPIMGSHAWKFPAEAFDPKRAIVRGLAIDAIGVFCFGAQVVEVEVDEVSGQVEVMEVWAAHDVGRALNPGAVEGQIHGAVVQGLGYGLCEELVWDGGRLANPTMMDYKIPGAADVPYKIHPIILEQADEHGPFGAKGIGEIGLVPAAAALGNAVSQAIGTPVRKIPVTGERVLRAMLGS